MEFEGFGKIPRYARGCVITEKLDGTNAQIYIFKEGDEVKIKAGSRNRWISIGDDNYGFAKWVEDNKEELIAKLGEGRHFGEWWGCGIQRGYGLNERRFSLFNTGKWGDPAIRPSCCHVVPVIMAGHFTDANVTAAVEVLRKVGSYAAPGYMQPEGVVIYHKASNSLFKRTLEDDDEPKSVAEAKKAVDKKDAA